jgi:type 1 glutamine amidotransferase
MLLFATLIVNLALGAEDGWVSLFDGKSLSGWEKSEDQDCFKIENGAIVANGNRSHLFYMGHVNGASFKNFEYKVEVKTEPGSNGGLYFHTAYQPTGWPSKGFEVQVNNSYTRDPRKTGSLYGIQDVLIATARDNEWYTEHITVIGQHVVVRINDRTVVDYVQPANSDKPLTRGTFALQGHDPGSKVHYRNIRVKPLPDDMPSVTAPKGWESLFDGKTLDGWQQKNGTARYEVVDGTIKGTTVKGSPNSFLCSRPFTDFELEAEVLVDSRLNSGIQIRSNSMPEYRNGRVHGYQAEIATNGTAGRIYDEARRARWLDEDRGDPAVKAAFKDGKWNHYRIVCIGDHIRTWVNGIPVADVTDAMTSKGFIGLQVHQFGGDTPASAQWRNIRIKEIQPDKPDPIKVVVVTGGHGFEREPFLKLWASLDWVDAVEAVQKDQSELFEDISAWDYDVIAFYNMTQTISEKRQANLLKLLDQGVGLVPLHHVLGAYQSWNEFRDIIGGCYYLKDMQVQGQTYKAASYQHDVDMPITIEARDHWITQGIQDFVIHDESYKGVWHAKDNLVLLTADHPTSDDAVAWTRTYKNARVCTIQLGHDGQAYGNPNFRRLLNRAIIWAAQR